jgi:hypothetical protein
MGIEHHLLPHFEWTGAPSVTVYVLRRDLQSDPRRKSLRSHDRIHEHSEKFGRGKNGDFVHQLFTRAYLYRNSHRFFGRVPHIFIATRIYVAESNCRR